MLRIVMTVVAAMLILTPSCRGWDTLNSDESLLDQAGEFRDLAIDELETIQMHVEEFELATDEALTARDRRDFVLATKQMETHLTGIEEHIATLQEASMRYGDAASDDVGVRIRQLDELTEKVRAEFDPILADPDEAFERGTVLDTLGLGLEEATDAALDQVTAHSLY